MYIMYIAVFGPLNKDVSTNEPQRTFWHMRTVKTQVRLCMCAVLLESARRNIAYLTIKNMAIEYSDPLQKYAYSNILKILPPKNENV